MPFCFVSKLGGLFNFSLTTNFRKREFSRALGYSVTVMQAYTIDCTFCLPHWNYS